MSRKRDREKRRKRLEWHAQKPCIPGSEWLCAHDAMDYIAAGWRCPDFAEVGMCTEGIPF